MGTGFKNKDKVLCQFTEVEGFFFQGDQAGVQFADIQQVIDKLEQVFSRKLKCIKKLFLVWPGSVFSQKVTCSQNGMDRRPYFVGDCRKKSLLGLGSGFGLCFCSISSSSYFFRSEKSKTVMRLKSAWPLLSFFCTAFTNTGRREPALVVIS